jgi:hypothetical protein
MASGDSASVVAAAVAAAAVAGVGVGVLIGASYRRAELDAERHERKAEHDGRIRLQRSLRNNAQGQQSAAGGRDVVGSNDSDNHTGDGNGGGKSGGGDGSGDRTHADSTKKVPRKRVNELGPPIGKIHSCFSRRNGTPRQGGDLVPSARCTFTLSEVGGLYSRCIQVTP